MTARYGLAAVFLLAGCAHMEAPPGGPVDTHRPYVTAVFPAPDSTRLSRELKAEIEFSEWVNPDAERNKVYLNPTLTHKLKTKLRGNVLEVTSRGRLDTNTTYTLGLLGTIKDLNGLPLDAPMQLVFSTGTTLDSGKVSGRMTAFQGKAAPGGFAALYPRGLDFRKRFQHLTSRSDSEVTPEAQPSLAKERPAYLAPTDSMGLFELKAVRPGRYALVGFQDINANFMPNLGTEALAVGPTVEVTKKGEVQSLALAPYDTLPDKLVEARWVSEGVRGNKTVGTVRLKFGRPPHPLQALRREAYAVYKAKKLSDSSKVPVPVQSVCLNPVNGEIELETAPLEPDSDYVAACPTLTDIQGNLLDTAKNSAAFKAGKTPDTTRPDMMFLGPRKVSGQVDKIPLDNLFPGRSITVYYPRLMTDSLLADLRAKLTVKLDTTPVAVTLARISHHEFSMSIPPLPMKGQWLRLTLTVPAGQILPGQAPDAPNGTGTIPQGQSTPVTPTLPPGAPAHATVPGTAPVPPASVPTAPAAPQTGAAAKNPADTTHKTAAPGDTARKASAPPQEQKAPIIAFTLADAAKLGSLKFHQDASARGSRVVLRSLSSLNEYSLVTPSKDEFTIDSLNAGWYAVDYFRDTNGDGIWNPGTLFPWTVQEPYAQWADSVEVKAGGVNDAGSAQAFHHKGAGSASAKGLATDTTSRASGGAPSGGVPSGTSGPSAPIPGAAPAAPGSTGPASVRKLSWPPTW